MLTLHVVDYVYANAPPDDVKSCLKNYVDVIVSQRDRDSESCRNAMRNIFNSFCTLTNGLGLKSLEENHNTDNFTHLSYAFERLSDTDTYLLWWAQNFSSCNALNLNDVLMEQIATSCSCVLSKHPTEQKYVACVKKIVELIKTHPAIKQTKFFYGHDFTSCGSHRRVL